MNEELLVVSFPTTKVPEVPKNDRRRMSNISARRANENFPFLSSVYESFLSSVHAKLSSCVEIVIFCFSEWVKLVGSISKGN